MSRLLAIFEDRGWHALRPLTELLPVPALAFGASSLWARWRARAAAPLAALEARALPLEAWSGRPVPEIGAPAADDEVLAVNAAVLPGSWIDGVLARPAPARWRTRGRTACVRAPVATLAAGFGRGGGFADFLDGLALPEIEVEARVLEHPWDLVRWNEAAIAEDLSDAGGTIRGEVHPSAVVLESGRVEIAPGAVVGPLAVLDARAGPIRIGSGATVEAHTRVIGPCVVGERTELLGGAVGHSTFGPECRVAGEVDTCVWQGYANKRHHGFVGHSVIGEWVNLGALTTTSDLKNNYGRVRVWVEGGALDTGLTKVGSFLGAGVRTGIGTLLPTGASIGTGSHLFGGGRFAPRRLPPFSWWDGVGNESYQLDKFLETARIAMGRRDRALTPELERAIAELWRETAPERAPGAA